MPIDTIKQDLENALDKAYQEMDSKDLIAIISQMITDEVCHSHPYSLSDYSLENGRLYHHSKLYLPNIKSLHLQILQESYNQLMAKHSEVAKTYKTF